MKVLIVADSRGRGLASAIRNASFTGELYVLRHSGATILDAVLGSLTQIEETMPDFVIVMAGICNVTNKNKCTKYISLKTGSNDEIIGQLMEQVNEAYKAIRSVSLAIVSHATIVGVDLSDCNNKDRRYMTDKLYKSFCEDTKVVHPDQERLNDIVLAVNRRLTDINALHMAPTVWMASGVHTYFAHKYHHRYARLKDGCHPTDKTLNYWARQVVRTVNRLKL